MLVYIILSERKTKLRVMTDYWRLPRLGSVQRFDGAQHGMGTSLS